jgi:transposase
MHEQQRTYKCSCGITEDRDIHAAKTMLWIYDNLVGRDAAEFTLEEFEAAMLWHYQLSKAQALDNDPRRCSVFS